MKHTYKSLVAALLALGFAVGVYAAEPAKPKAKEKTVKVNDETFVIPAEAEQGNANELLLKKFDLNRDGKIDDSEIAAAQSRAVTNRPPVLTKEDEGRKLTMKDLYEGGDPAKRKAPTKVSSDDFLKQYDVNHDGKIDAAELEMLKRDLEKNGTRQSLRTGPDRPLPPLPAKPQPVVRQPIR
jgi:Ca2+-binding EF-hand superfamily protein